MLFSLFLFALKSSVVLCVLYIAYHYLFRKNSHFQVRRILMLLTVGASLSLPLVEYRTDSELAPENPSIEFLDGLQTGKLEKELLTKKEQEAGTRIATNLADTRSFDWLSALTFIYGAGVFIMLFLFFVEIGRISWILHGGKARHDLDRVAITHKLIRFPFSFWRWIFLPAHLSYHKDTWKLIQEHENVHLQEGHTIDVVITSLVKCILWFNPAIYLLQKSMKHNHEALADRSVLKDHDMSAYSKALLEVCMQTGSLNLGHSFALKSNLGKRIETMGMSPTQVFRSIVSVIVFGLIGFGVFTQTSMYGQSFYRTQLSKSDISQRSLIMPYGNFALAAKHQLVIEKLQKLSPEKEYRFRYMSENQLFNYSEKETPSIKTEFFGRLTKTDKEDIYAKALQDSAKRQDHYSSLPISREEIDELIWQYIDDYQNYIIIYEWLPDAHYAEQLPIYEMDDVDVLPEPIGGLENFERTVALDIALPDHMQKTDLPEAIEFSFVVAGANNISDIDLVTELKGSKAQQDEVYKFFRLIHDSILSKTRSYYNWNRGMKDGQKVNVRMVVSIPTKYL